jgi:hypothetical protein
MGSDCTASALENRFRVIKRDGKRINDAISKGVDPLTLGIGNNEGIFRKNYQTFLLSPQHCTFSLLFRACIDVLQLNRPLLQRGPNPRALK